MEKDEDDASEFRDFIAFDLFDIGGDCPSRRHHYCSCPSSPECFVDASVDCVEWSSAQLS